jgi:hypothetical protein
VKRIQQMKFQIYVIFHKTLHKDFYESISEEVFREHITCIGVNEEIPKSYNPWFNASVIHENQFVKYNPLLQKQKYYESSVYHHIAHSTIINPYDYVGCIHYDMKITNKTLEHIQTNIDFHKNTNCLFYLDLAQGDHNICNSFGTPEKGASIWGEILQQYNDTFHTSFNLHHILYNSIPMFHCFVIPKHILQSLIPFIDKISPQIHDLLGKLQTKGEKRNTLPYHLERLWGFCLLLKKLEGFLPVWIPFQDIIHDESVKDIKNL